MFLTNCKYYKHMYCDIPANVFVMENVSIITIILYFTEIIVVLESYENG